MLKGMRFPVAALKPAAWLMFGASAIFAPIAAQAVTMIWEFNALANVNGVLIPRSGSGTLEATQVGATTWRIDSMGGTWAGEALTGVVTSYVRNGITLTSDNLFEYGPSLTNFRPTTGDGYAFTTANTYTNFYLLGAGRYAIIVEAPNTAGSPQAGFVDTPAPLPLLGLPAVLFYSRKIKKRIKQRSLASVSS